MKNLALTRVQNIRPYKKPNLQRQVFDGLLLDFNERLTPPGKNVIKGVRDIVKNGKLHIYPDYFDLQKSIARYAKVDTNQIMITNGSDHGIDIIFRTYTEKGDKVVIPSPTFAMFHHCARIIGNTVVSPTFEKESLNFPLDEVLAAVDTRTKLVVVCNPNNPTGTTIQLETIIRIAQKAKNGIVLVDEAYFEFSKVTAVPLIQRCPNIVVVRTFSKAFGLAGLRVGYVVANAQNIAEMLKVRGPYDVNLAGCCAALAAIKNHQDMEKYTQEVMCRAKPLVEKFFAYNTIRFFPSSANFILIKQAHPTRVQHILAKRGVLVRVPNGQNVDNTLRVSIGTVKQMKLFTTIYKDAILKQRKRKYAFLDRDGTLIHEPQDTYQIDSVAKLQILDGVLDGLKELKRRGYLFVMISNQDGLGTPSFPQEAFLAPHQEMLKIFKDSGIDFTEIFICPHLPDQGCTCRKPKTGLVRDFFSLASVDMSASFVCGDRKTDYQFAKNIGLRFVPMQTNGNFYCAISTFLHKSV